MQHDKTGDCEDGGGAEKLEEEEESGKWWPWIVLGFCLLALTYLPFVVWLGLAVIVWVVVFAVDYLTS